MHGKSEWMLSYRLAHMYMKGNRDNSLSVSTQKVLNNYMVAPDKMLMFMHMFGFMYGINDNLTFAAMTGFVDKEMDSISRKGVRFTLDNNGMTDTKINALYEFHNDGKHRIQFNAGLSLPTGSLDGRGSNGSILAYPMQTSSGTYDLLPGISYSGTAGKWSWGGQINTVLRLGKNKRDYALGNRYQLTGWGAHKLTNMMSISARLDGQLWENIDGTDRELKGPMFIAPTVDANLQAVKRIDALIGANVIIPLGTLQGNRLAVEFGLPLYESLDGPRLETDFSFNVGWQLAF